MSLNSAIATSALALTSAPAREAVMVPVFAPPPAPAPTPKPSAKAPAAPLPLTLSVQTSAGGAASSNNQPAGLLILVTSGGWPVTDLNQDHFTVMQHFDTPGNTFSNNIVSFRNAGSGAYLIQVRPNGGAVWRSGHLLGQLLVSSPDDRQGQAAFKLIIR